MTKLPDATITHTSPGRTRVKIPSKKGDHGFFSKVAERFSVCDGVREAHSNALTATVLLLHHSEPKKLSYFAEENNLFNIRNIPGNPVPLTRILKKGFDGLNKSARIFSKGQLDLSGLAVASLVGLSVFQIFRGNFKAPAWHAALWYAYNIGRTAEKGETSGEGSKVKGLLPNKMERIPSK